MKPFSKGLSDKRTPTFQAFATGFIRLNEFFWLFRISTAHLTQNASAPHKLSAVVEQILGERLDLSVSDVKARLPDIEQHARYYVLVYALTLYEEFVKTTLSQLGAKLPEDKTYPVKLRLADIPTGGTKDDMRNLLARARAQKIIDSSYEEREKSIAKLLKDAKLTLPPVPDDCEQDVFVACKLRNCIVHSAGTVDGDTYDAVSARLNVAIGAPIVLTDEELWKIVASLHKNALALDEAVAPSQTAKAPMRTRRRTKRRDPGTRPPSR